MKININIGIVGLLIVALGLHITYAYFSLDKPRPEGHPLLVPIQVGKTKTYVSQTRDAGMYIERTRRLAIIGGGCESAPRFGYKDSTNGSLEYFFISGLCPARPPKPLCPSEPTPVVWSNGDADDQICDIVDAGGAFGGYEVVDAGGAVGNVCDE